MKRGQHPWCKEGGFAHGRISLGIGGSSAKTDRTRSLYGWDQEQNLFNYGLPKSQEMVSGAESTTGKGLDSMGQVKDFFKSIMSGSRPAQLAAAAPEVNAVNTQADALKSQRSNFGTARGGGVNAAEQLTEATKNSVIDNALFGVRTGAASEVGKIGTQEAQVGLEQLSAALRMLGLSEEAIQHFIDSSVKSRVDSSNINRATQNQVREVLGPALVAGAQAAGITVPGY